MRKAPNFPAPHLGFLPSPANAEVIDDSGELTCKVNSANNHQNCQNRSVVVQRLVHLRLLSLHAELFFFLVTDPVVETVDAFVDHPHGRVDTNATECEFEEQSPSHELYNLLCYNYT
jgi:hypothetical protein